MPRASRYYLPGYVYHITHRCHNRSFLLRFAIDRDSYREWLREGASRYKVSVLGYCITCNHIHIIIFSEVDGAVSKLMQFVESHTAQQYNIRKQRKGAFWQDRYHCTIIKDGRHLWNCLIYVDLNMMRAGKVNHPRDWEWCGCREIIGVRKRYRVLDIPILLEKIGYSNISQVRKLYLKEIGTLIAGGDLRRSSLWTESLAVGDKSFIKSLQNRFSRVKLSLLAVPDLAKDGTWIIREARSPYG